MKAEVRCQSLYYSYGPDQTPAGQPRVNQVYTFRAQKKPKNAIDPQRERGEKGALDYVVTSIIPFLVNYFGKYYNRKDAAIRHKVVVADYMVDGLSSTPRD
ncbi:uncharacterized protein ACA1_292310 [Acanthamoeba castellanii str. Neff]|uniref:Uncharacterized protein n=1 Tax=Acanthamoeba castellanii (strain ATCC 30010 / Neff) TaxID=1257118 RepID=L8HLT2_ACACF|nr:uncharacterized protein ACA1_292310 [Acanthamoeba castellanii str. Neff]ELR25381.1 hypothetical protein ACA1_292310 [Acanthamoeba castellanii str. Neff]